MVTESSEIGKFLVSWTARRPHVCEILVQLLLSHLCIYKKFGAWPRLRPGQGYTREPAWILRNVVAPLQLREYISQIWGKACKIVSAWLQISLHQCHLKTCPTFTLSPTFNPISGSLLPLILKPLRDWWSVLMKDFATCKQGCISCGMCSYPELTKDHSLTSAYVNIFRTVTRNAINKSVWRKKDCFDFP